MQGGSRTEGEAGAAGPRRQVEAGEAASRREACASSIVVQRVLRGRGSIKLNRKWNKNRNRSSLCQCIHQIVANIRFRPPSPNHDDYLYTFRTPSRCSHHHVDNDVIHASVHKEECASKMLASER
mmetsp:Transcript_15239/g.27534  ORF Transcript_15239/g.27534 Transcript_15239/m.27534 type:complete len:125 (+) Transcript_15239:629-1003(+)